VRQFSQTEEEDSQSKAQEDRKSVLMAASEAGHLLDSNGWNKLVLPWIDEVVATATTSVMTRAGARPESEFMKGYAASLTDLRVFLSGIVDGRTQIYLEEEAEKAEDEEEINAPGTFGRFG